MKDNGHVGVDGMIRLLPTIDHVLFMHCKSINLAVHHLMDLLASSLLIANLA